MSSKVGVVIVTYNRKEYLKNVLEKLELQTYKVEFILIFDNDSSDGTNIMLSDKIFNKELKNKELVFNELNGIKYYYYRNDNNIGGAGGFKNALKIANEIEAEYYWIMDDDVLPEINCLENLIKYQDEENMIVIPNRSDDKFKDKVCLKINLSNPFKIFMKKKTTIYADEYKHKEYVNVVDMPFEGPLINSKLIEKIGYPDDGYFLQFDDTDYATRALKFTNIRFSVNAILHKQIIPNNKGKRRFMNWRDYYAFRNDILYCKKYGKNIFVRQLTPILLWINLTIKAILKFKFRNFRVINKAFIDGYMSRTGCRVKPGGF